MIDSIMTSLDPTALALKLVLTASAVYLEFIDHLYLYRFSALKWRNVIGAGEVSGHLYFTVQPAYFWRGEVSKPG